MEILTRRMSINYGSGCWEWIGHKDRHGYGRLYHLGKEVFAHRLSYAEWFGEIESSDCVCHKCDNPSCINPDHLFIGSQTENLKDMRKKGRGSFGGLRGNAGMHNPQAKLTDQQIDEIRSMRVSGVTYQGIADRFGISDSYAWMVVNGKNRAKPTPNNNELTKPRK